MKDKIISFIQSNKSMIILTICMIVVFIIGKNVYYHQVMQIDTYAYLIFVKGLRGDNLTVIMKFITNFGDAIVIIPLTILFFFLIRNKRIGFVVFINLIIIITLNQLLKFIIKRDRPSGFKLIHQGGYSFPSGHTMVSTAFYGLFIYIIYKKIKNKLLRNVLCIILVLLVIMIMISRIYLGVHYASDVIAGSLLSIAYLIIFIKIFKNYFI